VQTAEVTYEFFNIYFNTWKHNSNVILFTIVTLAMFEIYYTGCPKNAPLPNDQKIVLNCIKACECD